MASSDQGLGYSVTPTQGKGFTFRHASRKSDDLSASRRPSMKDGRSLSGGSSQYGPKAFMAAMTSANPPGSFSTDLKSAMQSGRTTPQSELANVQFSRLQPQYKEGDALTTSEQRQAAVRDKIAKEMKIKLGTENMLEALLSKNNKQTKEQRQRVRPACRAEARTRPGDHALSISYNSSQQEDVQLYPRQPPQITSFASNAGKCFDRPDRK